MSAPRVLHVADFAAPYPGSFIRQLEVLHAELESRGGRAAYAFPASAIEHEWFAGLRARGRIVVALPPASPRAPLRGWRQLAVTAAQVSGGVIHSHFGSYDLAAAAAGWSRCARGSACTVIWHYRTALEVPVGERSLRRRAKDRLKFGLVGGRVQAHLGVTEALAAEVRARGAGALARPLVSGCDTELYKFDPDARARVRAELGVAEDEVVVLHFGWMWRRKGGDLLAQAARILERRGAGRLRFVSLGGPPDEVEAPVEALPLTSRPQDVHAAADVFVSASRSEGFGNGVVEAMACERVAVAAAVEGQRETFSGVPGVLAVEPEDAHAIADAIAQLLARREEWPELGRRNRRHIETRYGLAAWARRMADQYSELGSV